MHKDDLCTFSNSTGSCVLKMLHHTHFTMNFKPTCCPTSTCWYSKIPWGHSMLVGRLCKLAGIKRYYTNHSLQATVTSRLFQPQRCVQLQKNLGWTKEALSNLLNRQPAGFSTAITPMQTPWSVPEQQTAAISTVLPYIHVQVNFACSISCHPHSKINFYVRSSSTEAEPARRKRRVPVVEPDSD